MKYSQSFVILQKIVVPLLYAKKLLTLIPNRTDNISQREEILELGDHIYIGNHMFEVDVVDYQDNNDLTATYFIDNVALFDVSRMMFCKGFSQTAKGRGRKERKSTSPTDIIRRISFSVR